MKNVFLCCVIALPLWGIVSCTKDNEFNYPMETLYGTWVGTEIGTDGFWLDLDDIANSKFRFSVTFHDDGTYYGRGYFGTGSGTYRAEGDMIYTYVNDKPYYNYRVISLNGDRAELEISQDGSDATIAIRVEKE